MSLDTPPLPASQASVWSSAGESLAQYTSVRLQVDKMVASGCLAWAWRKPFNVPAIWSIEKAKRPLKSSGAVLWFSPRAQTDIPRL